jgi:HPt (histidine-containing phosphotransfer) domain-containing protein
MMGNDLIDRAAIDDLLESVGGDLDFLEELLEDFFDDSPKQLVEMQHALEDRDAGRFRRAAHSLKSNSANFGALKLADSCKELEEMGKSATLDSEGNSLARAITEYEEVEQALKEVIDGYRS